jgi:predicted dehydrogenase
MNKVRWGVMGGAAIARAAVIPAIKKSSNGIVSALASRSPEAAWQWARPLGCERIVGGYHDLLDDPQIDAIYIPLPNDLHVEWASKAARAGKAVLCEKPLGLNAVDALRSVEASREAGVLLMEGFMYSFHPQHERALQLIAEGIIGDVREVQVHLSVDLMSPPDPTNVRFDPAKGGGALLDMGCYATEIARMIFGSEPERVQAHWQIDEIFQVNVATQAILDFSGGRVAMISCSFRGNGQGFYRVVGSKGMLDLPRGIILGLGDRAGEAVIRIVNGEGRWREEILPAVDQYQLMIESFGAAWLGHGPAPFSTDRSIANLRVLDAIAQSAASGSPIALTK